MIRIMIAAGGLALALAPAACTSKPPDIKPFDQVDQGAWRAALVSVGGRADPDLPKLYDVTKKDCGATVDQLSLEFTMANSSPAVTRIDLEHVCPSRADKVDQALEMNQQTKAEFATACATPPGQRTEKQQEEISATGPTACAP
jgi:hypothetical protein